MSKMIGIKLEVVNLWKKDVMKCDKKELLLIAS